MQSLKRVTGQGRQNYAEAWLLLFLKIPQPSFVILATVQAAAILRAKRQCAKAAVKTHWATPGCENEQISHRDDLKHALWLSNNVPKLSQWCAARPPIPSS